MSNIGLTTMVALCLMVLLWQVASSTSLFGRFRGYAPKPLMTPNEREFFVRLVRAHVDGYVFAQVAMSGLLEPRGGTARSRLAAFRQISQKRIDYTLHARDLSLLCVVELDDRTHHAAANKKRDQERDTLLRTAGIETLRFSSSAKPTVAQLRSAIAAMGGSTGSRGR